VDNALVIGELSLDGSVRHVRGVLPMAALAREKGFKTVFTPQVDAAEASLIPDLEVIPVGSIGELYRHLIHQQVIPPQVPVAPEPDPGGGADRLQRGQGTGTCQTCARSGCSWRTQYPDDGFARCRENPARTRPTWNPTPDVA